MAAEVTAQPRDMVAESLAKAITGARRIPRRDLPAVVVEALPLPGRMAPPQALAMVARASPGT